MNCDDRRDSLLLYVAGALEPAEAIEVRAHIASGCPQCTGALAEAEAVYASLAAALPPERPPPGLKARLMEAVASPEEAEDAGRRGGGYSLGRLIVTAALAACVAVLATGLAVYVYMDRKADQVAARLEVLNARDLQFVSLAGTPATPGARGRVLWDVEQRKWHVRVFDLKPPGPGRTYELWFITADGQKIPGGTFDVGPGGEGAIVASVPADLAIKVAAITDEPAGGSLQPTGQIHLAGEIRDAARQ